MHRAASRPWFLPLLFMLVPAQIRAQETPVRWTLRPGVVAPAPHESWPVLLVARIEAGWYLYSLTQPPGGPFPLEISLPEGTAFRLAAAIAAPAPESYADRNFGIWTEVYHDSLRLGVPLAWSGAAVRELRLLARYQACNDRYCLPPRTDTVVHALALAAAAARVAPVQPAAAGVSSAAPAAADAPQSAAPVQPAAAGVGAGAATAGPPRPVALPGERGASSFGSFLGLAVVMGLLSLLTPCVFPMVPITVGFFSKRTGVPRARQVSAALAYGTGIVLTFSAFGLLIALLFGAGGVLRLAANPWLNLVLAGMFVLFALNLLGLLEVRLPAGVLARAAGAGGSSGVAGALLMGAAFTLTTFTCTAPFVGTLLVLATQGSWLWPLAGLTAYAAAFALPFVLLALAPGALARLPRSGDWLRTLQLSLAVLELAAALKFLSNADLVWGWNVVDREVVLAGLVLAAALVTLLLLVRARPLGLRGRLASGALALGLAVFAAWSARGLAGTRLGELEAFLPPPGRGTQLAAADELPWRLNDYRASLAAARASNRPLFIDFTGYTCTNCRWMEANMFPRPGVKQALERYVRVRLFTDGRGEVYEEQQALQAREYGTVALPYYAIVSPEGRPLATFLGMTRDPQEFLQFLRRGLDPNVAAAHPND